MTVVTGPGPSPYDPILCQVAGWTVPGSGPIHAPATAPDALALVQRATWARLLGPLLLAVDSGHLDLPVEAVEVLVDRHRDAQLGCLHLEVRLLEVRSWFADAGGIEHVVLKGSAIAHLDELDPSLRSFGDLDLLVAGADLDRAVEVLATRGATRRWAERRPGYDRRFAKSVTMTCPDGVELDLHRSLADGVHGFRIPLGRLFAEPDSFELGGDDVPALAPVHRMLHSAYHAVLGSPSPRLMSLRDVAGYLARPSLGPEVVVPEVKRWRGEAVLAPAVGLVAATLGTVPPPWQAWADSVATDKAEAAVVDRQRREGSALGRGKLDALRELSTPRARAAYALALAVPSSEHLRSRGLRRRDLLR